MKLLHFHLASKDIGKSRDFYSTVFQKQPAKEEADYLEWVLEEQGVVFSVSASERAGLRSLGMIIDDAGELEEQHVRLGRDFDIDPIRFEGCCHAGTRTFWLTHQDEVPWMFFQKTGSFDGLGAVAAAAGDEPDAASA